MPRTIPLPRSGESLARWFAPPLLETRELTQRARTLWSVSWPFLAVVTVVLSVSVVLQPETLSRRAITIGGVGAIVAVLHELNRRGRTTLASWTLVAGLTLLVTQRAWGTGGVHAPVAVFYVLFIIMAGALLGMRGSVVVTAMSVLGSIVLAVSESNGWLIPLAGAGSPAAAFVFVMLAVGLALVLQNLLAKVIAKPEPPREDLVQMVVHDMRSPLTALLAQLSLLREDAPSDMTGRVDEAIDGARNLNRLAANMLDVSRFEGRHMPVKRTPTEIVGIARGVVRTLRAIEPDRHIELFARSKVACRCDGELVRRILENLVGNAIKHTPSAGRIRIRVDSLEDRVAIAVEDEGSGISEEARSRMFERFGAATLRTPSGYDSTGLGLAFCKLAAESHGGTIRVESTTNGSTFIVELPMWRVLNGHSEA